MGLGRALHPMPKELPASKHGNWEKSLQWRDIQTVQLLLPWTCRSLLLVSRDLTR